MKHILFIDPLEKLCPKKDSSLQFALTLKEMGREVYLLFEKDFFFVNYETPVFECYLFDGAFLEQTPYLEKFNLGQKKQIVMNEQVILHMRIDPPFDTRYLRYLWMLRALKTKFQIKVVNDPQGILIHNEKMICYESQKSVGTYVGSSEQGVLSYINSLKANNGAYPALIMKPIDLYQGIGVVKIDENSSQEEIMTTFSQKREEFKGPVVIQPFIKEVEQGEIRSIFFAGKELGSILKTPPKGEFLANIAQGATYERVELSQEVKIECERYCRELLAIGVPWVAFDILGDIVQEANITCPGLLVEVSSAMGKNLAVSLIIELEKIYS